MTVVLRPNSDTSDVESVIGGLIRAWNNGDALSFAGFFEEEGDLVNIHGMHLHGRQAIAGLYDMLFRSIFLASSTDATLSGKRLIGKNVALIHARIAFHSPAGAMAGDHNALATLVLVRHGSDWRIASLHNTRVTAPEA